MSYLLDTNVVSALIRDPHGRVTKRIRKVGEAKVCTSIVVAAELRYGAVNKGSPRLQAQLEAVLSALEVISLTLRRGPQRPNRSESSRAHRW